MDRKKQNYLHRDISLYSSTTPQGLLLLLQSSLKQTQSELRANSWQTQSKFRTDSVISIEMMEMPTS